MGHHGVLSLPRQKLPEKVMSEVAVSFDAGIVHLPKFLQSVGVSRSTGWRWVKAGLLRTVNIYGRSYVTREARDEFLARVEKGEFAQEPVTPKRG